MGKKAYFFAIDAVIALFVLALGVGLSLAFFTYKREDTQVGFFSSGSMDFLTKNKIIDLNDDYAGPSGLLYQTGNITNIDNTILTQACEFYYRNTTGCIFCLNISREFLEKAAKPFIPAQYNYRIMIDNITIYEYARIPPNGSVMLLTTRKIMTGLYDNTLWGPYAVEVWSWR